LALLVLPSLITASFKLAGKPQPRWLTLPMRWINWLLLGFAVVLVVGSRAGTALQSILVLVGVALPVIWLIHLGANGLWGKHPQRDSGMLSFSLGFTTIFIMVVELVVVVILLIGFGTFAAANPQLQQTLLELFNKLQSSASDSEGMIEALQPLLDDPTVMTLILVLFAGIVPLIEEALKTLGVWFLAGKKVTPAEGYVAGLMSGAGFALVEGLLNATQMSGGVPADWFPFVLGRFGGSLLHCFNGGLLGWALASTWRDKKVWRVVGVYLLTVVVHGLWNGIALTGGVTPMLQGVESAGLGPLYYLPLIILSVLMLTGFFLFTRRVHHQDPAGGQEVVDAGIQ
ncbi:MAG: PrsW family glutamic-type intramembrane protease, partial [Anaerolineaceae bacterium]